MRTHPDIGLMTASLQQTCCKLLFLAVFAIVIQKRTLRLLFIVQTSDKQTEIDFLSNVYKMSGRFVYRTDTHFVNYLSNGLKQSCFQITFKK